MDADKLPCKVCTLEQLFPLRARWKEQGKVVVWTNGCFDLLHVGHVRSLREARGLGDVLIVGLNSDKSIRCLKGSGRPLVPEAERAEVIAALESVDAVVIFSELTPERMLSYLQPNICCKGADYAPPHGKPVPEAVLVQSYGGRMAYLSFSPGISTTELARRASEQRPDAVRSPGGRPAVFLDRDGTLVEEVGYPGDPQQLRLLPGAIAALTRLRVNGYALVVVSNQSGVGRGILSQEQAGRVHQGLVDLLEKHGVALDGAYYCYHAPADGCRCRKPSPQLLLTASHELGLDLARSFMIGDKLSDVQAGRAAGGRTVLFADHLPDGSSVFAPDFVTRDWSAVVDFLLAHTREAL
jgi:rfaE bifunctional protein nucleotidyltransferase chain/domain